MAFLVVFVVSVFIASFVGHVVHWMLHRPWVGRAYVGHMEHHLMLYPPRSSMTSDTYRSPRWYHNGVFLYAPVFIVLVMLAYVLATALSCPMWVVTVFGASLLALGAINNWAHDSFHVNSTLFYRLKCYRTMRRRHHVHHRNMRCNYGIVTSFWDRVFGTLREGLVTHRMVTV